MIGSPLCLILSPWGRGQVENPAKGGGEGENQTGSRSTPPLAGLTYKPIDLQTYLFSITLFLMFILSKPIIKICENLVK